jgi:hypothetical protein
MQLLLVGKNEISVKSPHKTFYHNKRVKVGCDLLPTLLDGASSFPSWSRSLMGSDASPTSMGLRKVTRLHTLLTHYPAPYSGEFLAMLDSDLMHGLPHAYPCHSADWSLTGGYASTQSGTCGYGLQHHTTKDIHNKLYKARGFHPPAVARRLAAA